MLQVLKDKDAFFKPIVSIMPKWVHPTILSLVRFFFIPIVVILVLQGYYELAVLLVLFGFFLDGLDGTMARVRKQQTQFGAIIDPLADKGLFLVALIMLGVYLLPFNLLLAIIILETVITVGSLFFMIIFAVVGGVDREIGANIFGKLKTTFQVVALILLGFGHSVELLITAAIILLWISLGLHVISMGRHIFSEHNSDAH